MNELFLKILTFPFTLLGNALRSLSLSGTIGNIAAIVLYLAIAALPLLFKWKKKWQKEDWLLPVTSVLILYVLYYFINPGLRPLLMNTTIGNLTLALLVYSVLIFWSIIKLLQSCSVKDRHYLYRVLKLLLSACAVVFLIAGPILGYFDFRAIAATVKEGNTAFGVNLTPTMILLFAGYVADALAAVLNAILLLFSIRLLKELEQDPYSENCFQATQTLKLWCRRFLLITLGSCLLVNLCQVLFAKHLYKIATAFNLPLGSIALTVGLFVLATLISEGKQLKEDNDLFI